MDKNIIKKLTAGFKNVFEKEGPFDRRTGKRIMLKYVSGADVIERLNTALDYNWSFEILDHKVEEDQVIVHGRFRYKELETNTEIIRENFGSSIVKRYSSGQNSGKPIDLGFDYKGATTDCIKKCATMIGVALKIGDMGTVEDNDINGDVPEIADIIEQAFKDIKSKPETPKATSKTALKEEAPQPASEESEESAPIKFPGEKNIDKRPPKPKYESAPMVRAPEPSKKMEKVEAPQSTETSREDLINANQLSVLKSMVVRKGRSESKLIKEALNKDDSPDKFDNLTRTEAKKVLALAYELPDKEA